MTIPTYDLMMRPILELAAREGITRASIETNMAEHFRLSPAERAQMIPSGHSRLVQNRAGWAMTYLTKAGLISRVSPKTYRATDTGRAFLAQHVGDITRERLLTFAEFRQFLARPTSSDNDGGSGDDTTAQAPANVRTPVEDIDAAVNVIHSEVRQRLLEAILQQSPAFFERLVLEVLTKMGYGDMAADGVIHTGRSGDEGIDGRINQDVLGLDQVLVQAKRFHPDQVVSRKEIQAFIGSLAGQGVTKGVFITTSSFAASAHEFVQRGSQTKIVLIDGTRLLDLMMRYKVGVRAERAVELLEIDQNYFTVD